MSAAPALDDTDVTGATRKISHTTMMAAAHIRAARAAIAADDRAAAERAFERLLRIWHPFIWRWAKLTARRPGQTPDQLVATADDLVQELHLHLWALLHTETQSEAMERWSYRALYYAELRVARDYLTRIGDWHRRDSPEPKRGTLVPFSALDRTYDGTGDPDTHETLHKPLPGLVVDDGDLATRFDDERIWAYVAKLTPRLQAFLELRYGGDLTLKQIAACLGMSFGGVARLAQRAIPALRAVMPREEEW